MAEKLIVPPSVDDLALPMQAPLDTEGRSSFNEAVRIIDSGEGHYLPVDAWDRPLSPMETDTDVVLPIIAKFKSKPNRHHAYFYERHYKSGSLPIQAVRNSRLQLVDPLAHSIYHKRYFGTVAPTNEAAAARAIILNSAGYVAAWGVEVSDKEPSIAEISPRVREKLRRPNLFSVERPSKEQKKMADFLIQHALKQKLDHVKQSQVEEFIELTARRIAHNDKLQERKLHLGLRLTNIALNVAVEPVEPEYQEARRRRTLRNGTPSTAWQWAKGLIRGRELVYMGSLEKRLTDEYGLAT